MAAGAGLPLLALLVTGLHFVIVLGYTPLGRLIATRGHAERAYTITYEDGRGVLRDLLTACTTHAWTVNSLAIIGRPPDTPINETTDTASAPSPDGRLVTVGLTLTGPGAIGAATTLGAIDGVIRVDLGDDEDE
jgi:putative Mg2+ transporter-C (MgtC) family protein